jgi:hypothetical protein
MKSWGFILFGIVIYLRGYHGFLPRRPSQQSFAGQSLTLRDVNTQMDKSYENTTPFSPDKRSKTMKFAKNNDASPNSRKYFKSRNGKSRVNFRSKHQPRISAWERKIRNSIKSGDWNVASQLLSNNLHSCYLPSGRNIVYIITETCQKCDKYEGIR